MNTKKKIFYLLMLVLIIIYLPIFGILGHKPDSKLVNTDAILILGYSLTEEDAPSPILVSRLEDGLFLYNENISDKIILSGGRGPTDNRSVASAMKIWLSDNGVLDSDIILEENSRDTIENFKYSSDICNEKGFESLTIVSSDFHMYRSSIISEVFFDDEVFFTQEYFTYSPISPEKALNLLKEPLSLIKVYFYKLLDIIQ